MWRTEFQKLIWAFNKNAQVDLDLRPVPKFRRALLLPVVTKMCWTLSNKQQFTASLAHIMAFYDGFAYNRHLLPGFQQNQPTVNAGLNNCNVCITATGKKVIKSGWSQGWPTLEPLRLMTLMAKLNYSRTSRTNLYKEHIRNPKRSYSSSYRFHVLTLWISLHLPRLSVIDTVFPQWLVAFSPL